MMYWYMNMRPIYQMFNFALVSKRLVWLYSTVGRACFECERPSLAQWRSFKRGGLSLTGWIIVKLYRAFTARNVCSLNTGGLSTVVYQGTFYGTVYRLLVHLPMYFNLILALIATSFVSMLTQAIMSLRCPSLSHLPITRPIISGWRHAVAVTSCVT